MTKLEYVLILLLNIVVWGILCLRNSTLPISIYNIMVILLYLTAAIFTICFIIYEYLLYRKRKDNTNQKKIVIRGLFGTSKEHLFKEIIKVRINTKSSYDNADQLINGIHNNMIVANHISSITLFFSSEEITIELSPQLDMNNSYVELLLWIINNIRDKIIIANKNNSL